MKSFDAKKERKRFEKKLEALITEVLKLRHRGICQICNQPVQGHGGQFHVLPKGGLYANLKYRPENILYAGWYDCHYPFHHNYYTARDRIYPRLIQLLGDGFEERLQALSRSLPKTTLFELEKIEQYWQAEKISLLKGTQNAVEEKEG